jgi:linoleoyl-CoA desaturase
MFKDTILNKPHFLGPEHDSFFAELKLLVRNYTTTHSKFVYIISGIKTILFILAYILLYIGILKFGNNLPVLFSIYAVMGVLVIMIFLNIIHPAAHNSLFRNKLLNNICQYLFEFLGTSSYLWKVKHVRLHHPYANIPNWDCDIEQSDIIKIFPEARHFWYHRYQYIYGPFMYLMYTLIWIFYRDFKDLFDRNRIVSKAIKIPKYEFIKLIFVKTLYVFYVVIVPCLVLDITVLNVITAFFLMHFISSGLGFIALVSTHAGEDAKFTYLPKDGKINQTWAFHQLLSTNDFSTDNAFANLAYGYFNHHVAHHLFPSTNPQLYPGITRIIKNYAAENNLPYRCYTINQTLRSHYKLLKNNSIELILDAEL